MKDTLSTRYAYLGISENNKDISRNIRVQINLKGRLPLISLSQASGYGKNTPGTAPTGYNMSISELEVSDNVLTRGFNVLVDKADTDRYKLIAVITSKVTRNESYLVYDAKYTDMILIPSLLDFGEESGNSDILRGNKFNIDGYLVGGSSGLENGQILSINNSSLSKANLPAPITTISSTTYVMNIQVGDMVKREQTHNNVGIMLGNDYLESDKRPVCELVSLGKTSDLFNTSIPMVRLIKQSMKQYNMQDIGRVSAEDMLIYLPYT